MILHPSFFLVLENVCLALSGLLNARETSKNRESNAADNFNSLVPMKPSLLVALSIGPLAINCKKKGGAGTPTPQPIPVTYNSDINLASVQQTFRGFGGATVFRPDLTDADITTLFGTPDKYHKRSICECL